MKKIVIIGAGPAGLTAALELVRAGIKDVVVLEADTQVGGISKTVVYKGNRIDIGGHRFFSKSDWVMDWWLSILPIENRNSSSDLIELKYQGKSHNLHLKNEIKDSDAVMMIRNRKSRIFFNGEFFSYPLKLNLDSLRKLGLIKTIAFGFSYIGSRFKPIAPEKSLEDFLTNRFGKLLYLQFFKEYTEKVWGVPCSEISAEWGAQRIKSLSILNALWHALKETFWHSSKGADQTSLIEKFIYPKFGPGQMWESVAEEFKKNGGTLLLKSKVSKIDITDQQVRSVIYLDEQGSAHSIECTHLISTMPIKDLAEASKEAWEPHIISIAHNLAYRDFITVGLLYDEAALVHHLDDNWIYIQEPGVQVGRVQVFNNWSPYLVAKPGTVWLGLEFFCKEGDSLWGLSDDALKSLAQKEMGQIGLTKVDSCIDSVVLRVPKAYPGYFGDAYKKFKDLQACLDEVDNLFLIGRNGMHRYNNQDHSMLTAKEAANQVISGMVDKANIWNINVGDDYHEQIEKN
jgi:protoporphyrinogen oxidase